MPSKRPKFTTNELYHIFNRGVEKREIFSQISDFFRFIFCLYELNEKGLIKMRNRIEERKYKNKKREAKKYTGATRVQIDASEKEALVEILVFCLMPNHYHLILRQLVDNGISLFVKKLADSYVGYFNEKYNRKGMGSLFQGRFKAVHIKDNKQFFNLTCYIFTNPLEIIEKEWKETGFKDTNKAIQFLKSYRWSNFLDCIEITNFPSVTKRDFVIEFFGNAKKIEESIKNWISYKTDLKSGLENIKDIIFE